MVKIAVRFSSIFSSSGQKIEGKAAEVEDEVIAASSKDVKRPDALEGEAVLSIRRLHILQERPYLDEETRLVLRLWPGIDSKDCCYDRITLFGQKFGIALPLALERVTPFLYPELQAKRLSIDVSTPVLHLERTVFDQIGRKVEWRSGFLRVSAVSYCSVTS